jgi:hypothetical protein
MRRLIPIGVIVGLLGALTGGPGARAEKPACEVIGEAWVSAYFTAPAVRMVGISKDGKELDPMIVVGDSIYRKRGTRWYKDPGTLSNFSRQIIFAHTIGPFDPKSCQMLGTLQTGGETFAIFRILSGSNYNSSTPPFTQLISWVDGKGQLRGHSTGGDLLRYDYDGVTAPPID